MNDDPHCLVDTSKQVGYSNSGGATTTRTMGPLQFLSNEELRLRLALDSPELVQELHDTTQRQIQFETGRQARLDAKAVSLLTASGLSLTVASSLGAVLLSKVGRLQHWWTPVMVLTGVIGGLAFGLTAAIFAVLALRVSEYLSPDESAIFHAESLKNANNYPGLTASSSKEETRRCGLMEYRKFMIVHLWPIVQRQCINHEKKARLIRIGQSSFVVFLFLLLLVCICVVIGAAFPSWL